MSNLKEETLSVLTSHGKQWSDVKWIGHKNGNVKIHPEYFLEIADREYDAGFGSVEVNTALVVVGDGWWLERWEYDGSVGWTYKEPPVLSADTRFGKALFVKDYDDDWSIMSNLEYLEWETNRRVQ